MIKTVVHYFDIVEYSEALTQMKEYTASRNLFSDDQLWFLEHYPVFTQGTSCQLSPKHNPRNIPMVKTDRGGQITYHGPGQLVVYILVDLKRKKLGVRHFVNQLEQIIIDFLAESNIDAHRKEKAPGVYVGGKKIAALGLRIKNGCTYHGLSLNVDMDLEPFSWIDPCGYVDMEVVNMTDYNASISLTHVKKSFEKHLLAKLNTAAELVNANL